MFGCTARHLVGLAGVVVVRVGGNWDLVVGIGGGSAHIL